MSIGITKAIINFGIEVWKTIAMLIAKSIQLGIATAAFLIHTTATVGVTVATTAMSVATWALNAAMLVLTSPIGLVVVAIGGIIAVGYLLITHWQQVQAIGKTVFNTVSGFFTSLGTTVKGVVNTIIGDVKGMVNGI